MTKNSTRARASKMLELSPDWRNSIRFFPSTLTLPPRLSRGRGKNAELFKLILIFAGLSLVSCLEQRDGFYCFKHLWCMMNYNMMEIAAVSSPVRWKLCISAICCKTGSISGPLVGILLCILCKSMFAIFCAPIKKSNVYCLSPSRHSPSFFLLFSSAATRQMNFR